MTSYYKGNNIGLNYDAANATWSFVYEPNDFIDPASFSTADPAFDYTPPPSTDDDDDQDDDFNPCPAGYIYDSTLKQCVPDPNQQTSYQQDTTGGGGGSDQPDPTRVEFKDMKYHDMIKFGQSKGYFNEVGTYIGAPESKAIDEIKWIAQLGLDSQAARFAKEFAKKGGKVWNPNETSLIGNLYIPKRDDLARLIAGTGTFDIASDYNKKIQAFNTASMNKVKAEFGLLRDKAEVEKAKLQERDQFSLLKEQAEAEKARLQAERERVKLEEEKEQFKEQTSRYKEQKERQQQQARVEKRQAEKEAGTGGSFGREERQPEQKKETYQHPFYR